MTETEKEYFQICAWRFLHPLPKTEYGEVHHVLPKSCGGPNRKWNLVRLTPEEHYRCHCLLPKIFDEKGMLKEKDLMCLAWHVVNATHNGIKISEEEYGKLKREYAIVNSKRHRGKIVSEESRRKMSESAKGKKLTAATRKKIGNAVRNRIVSEETRRKLSEINKGRVGTFLGKHHTEEARKKLSEANKGKHLSSEARKIISQKTKAAMTEEVRKRLSEAKKAYYARKRAEQCKLQSQSQS